MLRIAGYQGPSSILTRGLACFVETLTKTGWKSAIDWVPNVTDKQEKAADLFTSIETGTRHVGYMASGYLSARVPELEVLELPFSVEDRVTALAALDHLAGDILKQSIRQRTGFHVLGFWDNGFRHISNSVRPIQHPNDTVGIKIRTLDSALYRATLDAIGFQALTSDVKDLVSWIAQDIVQAQENPLTTIEAKKFYEVQKAIMLTGHIVDGLTTQIAPHVWNKLSDA